MRTNENKSPLLVDYLSGMDTSRVACGADFTVAVSGMIKHEFLLPLQFGHMFICGVLVYVDNFLVVQNDYFGSPDESTAQRMSFFPSFCLFFAKQNGWEYTQN